MGASNGRNGCFQCNQRPPYSILVIPMQVQPGEWEPPVEVNGRSQWKKRSYRDLGFEYLFSSVSDNPCKLRLSSRNYFIPIPAGSRTKRWVPPMERMGAFYGTD